MANPLSGTILAPLTIYKEWEVLGVTPTTNVNASFDISLGNTALNSQGNSTVNSAANVGYTVLPGGVIMQWGVVTAGTPQAFPIPFPTNVFSWSVTGQAANVTLATANSTKISVTASAGTPISSFLAIGN